MSVLSTPDVIKEERIAPRSGLAYVLWRREKPSERSGGKIVFLHGYMQTGADSWREPARRISAALGHDCLVVDFPAHGRSKLPGRATRQQPAAELLVPWKFHMHVRKLIEELGWDRSDQLTLAGMSLGAAVVLQYHQKWPVRRVVLVAASGWEEDAAGRAVLWALIRKLLTRIRAVSETWCHPDGLLARLLAKWTLPSYGPTYGLDYEAAVESLLKTKHVALVHGSLDEFHKERFSEWSGGRKPDWFLRRGLLGEKQLVVEPKTVGEKRVSWLQLGYSVHAASCLFVERFALERFPWFWADETTNKSRKRKASSI